MRLLLGPVAQPRTVKPLPGVGVSHRIRPRCFARAAASGGESDSGSAAAPRSPSLSVSSLSSRGRGSRGIALSPGVEGGTSGMPTRAAVAHVERAENIDVQVLQLEEELSTHTMKVLREHAKSFKHVDKEDEPPLRVLEHGLFGEGALVAEGAEPPHPHMIRRGDKCFLGYRFDQDLCDEVVHATPELRRVFGVGDKEADAIFRNTLGYASAGSEFETADGGILSGMLRESLTPLALRVFGEEENPEAHRLSRMYSLYANLLLPGQIINLHLDVPEFVGVDRSTCPNWLLVAAHCSGLFESKRVRNVTTVFYPSTAQGGALAIYPSITAPGGASCIENAKVYPAKRGMAVVMDADSCFHHSEQARHGGIAQGVTEEVLVPKLPTQCSVEVLEGEGEPIWVIKEVDTGEELCRHPESDVRFSVSCKIHVFGSQEEVDRYDSVETPASEKLSGSEIVAVLAAELQRRGKLATDCDLASIPLYDLGPIIVQEYVAPHAPASDSVQRLWTAYHEEVRDAYGGRPS